MACMVSTGTGMRPVGSASADSVATATESAAYRTIFSFRAAPPAYVTPAVENGFAPPVRLVTMS